MLKILENKYHKKIDRAYKLVNIYEFTLSGLSTPPEPFKVKILITSDEKYICRISHFVHRTGLDGPHRASFSIYSSEEEALREAFSHGLMNYDPNDSGAKWEKNECF